jgi:acetylornithine deacetylase/succinyl-diaminopimelate desuccinylase-like protein
MKTTLINERGPLAVPPPLDPKIVGPAEKLVAKYHPGVPLIPTMSTAATDGVFLEAVGIPSYGPPGVWLDPDDNGKHGLNERVAVEAVYSSRDLLTELVQVYANQE